SATTAITSAVTGSTRWCHGAAFSVLVTGRPRVPSVPGPTPDTPHNAGLNGWLRAHTPAVSPRRVLHVAHHVLPHIGGLETVVDAETRGLRARGWQIAPVSSADVPAWNGLEERYGVPFPIFSPRLVPALGRQVRRADIVHI